MKYTKAAAIVLTLAILTAPGLCQDFSFDFNKPSKTELEMSRYGQDAEAEALIIYDKGRTKFRINTDYSINVMFTRRTKIKIIDQAGLAYAEVEIPVYRHGDIYEKVDDIKAYAYNIENGIIKTSQLDIKQVFEEKVSENWYRVKFAIPNVKTGTVIEYSYVLESQSKFTLPDWEFQHEIPILLSEYEIYMTPFYQYTYLLQGAGKFDSYTSVESPGLPVQYGPATYKEVVNTYTMKNLPAFRDEEFITSKKDYIIKLNFQLASYTDVYGTKTEVITTWPKLSDELLGDTEFGKYIKSAGKQARKVFDFEGLAGLKETDKYLNIIRYVKSNYNWNGYKGYMASKSPGKFISEKTGSAADINLFLCGMLQEAGLDAKPLLISTRDHGKIWEDYPFAHFFNYVLVLVENDGNVTIGDATDSYCPDNLIPVNCINGKGLIVEKESNRWASLSSNIPSMLQHNFYMEPKPEKDSILADMKIRATNYEATRLRKIYENKPSELEKYLLEHNLTPVGPAEVKNYEDVSQPFYIDARISYPMETINNKIYILPFFEEPVSENPLKQQERSYPIDMTYAKTMYFTSQISVPEGYKVEYLPDDMTVDSKLVKVEYKVNSQNDDKLIITGLYQFHQAIYEPEDYKNLKYYFNQIVKKFNERIVLAKE